MSKTARDLRALFQSVSKAQWFTASDTTAASWIAGKAGHTIFIQRVQYIVTTDAAQSANLRDSASTNPAFAALPASPGTGPQVFEYGDEGIPLVEAAGLSVVLSAAGLAFLLRVEGYMKPTAASRAA